MWYNTYIRCGTEKELNAQNYIKGGLRNEI